MIIRLFHQEDIDEVLNLANKHAAFDGESTEADFAVSGYFPEGFWVAEEDNRVIGFVFGYFKDIPIEVLNRWGASKVGEIALLVVDSSYRRKGVGTALLQKILAEFSNAKANIVLVNCPAEAIEAKSLYDRLGFKVRAYQMTMTIQDNL